MAFTGALEALSLMIRGSLGVPPGVVVRPSSGVVGGGSGSSVRGTAASALGSLDFVNSIVDITADDVCVGNSPGYFSGLDTVSSPALLSRLSLLRKALNKIMRWAAVDVLKTGLSMYALQEYVERGRERLALVPFNEEVYIYMRRNGSVLVVDKEGKAIENILMFLSYSKETLVPLGDRPKGLSEDEGKQLLYQIIPEPIQLKNATQAADDLARIKSALADYRNKVSKILRFVTVDVGTAQGDRIQEVIDSVSQYINAPSSSLTQMSSTGGMMFDDGIPIIPYRKGAGKPELTTDIPSFDISNIADMDQALGELFLSMQFPKSYADFNNALNETTVSLLRGDIRYARLVGRARYLLEDTVNEWLPDGLTPVEHSVSEGREVKFKLVKLPTTEDTDVVETLDGFSNFTGTFLQTLTQAENRDDAVAVIDSLEKLLADTSNLPAIQNWFAYVRSYVAKRFDALAAAEAEEAAGEEDAGDEMPPMDYEAPDFGGGADEGPTPEDVSAEVGSEADAAGMPSFE